MVQSVDSIKLLDEIGKHKTTKTKVLLQVNIGKEEQKNGFFPDNFEKTVEKMKVFDTIDILGLMCIPPKDRCPKEYFLGMYDLYQRLKENLLPNMKYLSMGMSGDFEMAIECGSNMVRVGSCIFGPRI